MKFRTSRRRMLEDLDQDIRDHIESETQDNIARGMPPDEARYAALRKFGNVTRAKEDARDVWTLVWLEQLLQDVRYALRTLTKQPGFTLLAALCLALGIGVNTSVFTLLDFALLRPLHVPEPECVTILSRDGSPLFPFADYADYRDRSVSFTALAATIPTESSLDSDDEPHHAAAEAVSANYAETMQAPILLGRWFTNEGDPAAVLSYSAWRRFFHADPQVLGKRVRSESHTYTIIGVATPEFTGIYSPLQTDIWVPLRVWISQYPEARANFENRAHPGTRVMVFGRLNPGVAVSQAAANLNAIDSQIRRENPSSADSSVAPLALEVVHGAPSPVSRRSATSFVTLLFFVAGIVLMIACINVGNLLLARGASRQRELSVRAALGASRVRLMRQLLVETLLLSLLGAAIGILFAHWTNRFLSALFESLPVEAQVSLRVDLSLDWRVLGFALALSFVCSLLCGVFPAWRSVTLDVFPVLKGGASSPRRRSRLRRLTLVAQVGLSLILLLCSGLFLRSMQRMRASDPGFAVQNRLCALTYISPPEFNDATGLEFYNQTLDRLRALPGVRSASLTHLLPLMATGQETSCVSTDRLPRLSSALGVVAPGFLATMRIPLLEGRDFTPADSPASRPVVLVNQTLANRLWPGTAVVGQHLRFGCTDYTTAEVVGIVRDIKVRSLSEPPQPYFYLPFAQRYTGLATLVIETPADVAVIAPEVRAVLRAQSLSARLYALEPLSAHVERSFWIVRWESAVLFLFGVLALVLAAVGLYGVLAFYVTQRTQEIAVRVALGARPSGVYRLILGEGMRITLLGVSLGIVASAGLARLLSRFLAGLSPADPIAFGGASLLWIAVALLACSLPARRAMRVNPITALRHE